jgi:hypothetical protein
MFKVLFLTAIKHPKAFAIGVRRGLKKARLARKNPDYIRPSAEVRDHTKKELVAKLKTLI